MIGVLGIKYQLLVVAEEYGFRHVKSLTLMCSVLS